MPGSANASSAPVVVQLDTPGRIACTGWLDVATTAPVHIVVHAPAITRATTAGELYDEINAVLGRSGALRKPDSCAGATRHAWEWTPATACRRLVVYVDDAHHPLDPGYDTWIARGRGDAIPVLEGGLRPEVVLPVQLRRSITIFHAPGAIRDCAAPVLSRMADEMGGPRIFISYRHQEAAAVATQLFTELSKARYDVFLDRYRGQPGQDFMALIREQIVARRCILVLETPNVLQSVYVVGEVAMATRLRIGLLAIDLPGSRQVFRGISARIDLRSAALAPGDPNASLTRTDVSRVIAELVDRYYAAETAKRWRFQRQVTVQAASAAGLSISERAPDLFEVSNGKQSISCMTSALPLAAPAFMRMDLAATAPSLPRVLFGAVQSQGRRGRAEVNWLRSQTNIEPRDEGLIFRTMRRFARGMSI
jgi:hypothetical protein